ncbi:MAG: Uma2 family endonuclease [Moorea sp. SIO3C2]|nr:Uma2 family endonuclease [Moorena sp. SIO3C2]
MVQIPAIPETDNLQIELPRSIGLSITLEQFVELEAANRDLRLERTAKGELIVNPPTGWETGNRNGRINQQLFNWADVDGTGIAFDSSTGFRLPNGAIRSPDASWVSQKPFLMQSLMGETPRVHLIFVKTSLIKHPI